MELSTTAEIGLNDVADQVSKLDRFVKSAKKPMHLLAALLGFCCSITCALMMVRGTSEKLPPSLAGHVTTMHGVLLETNAAATKLGESTLLKRVLAGTDYNAPFERAGATLVTVLGELGTALKLDMTSANLAAEFKAAAERDRINLLVSFKDMLAAHHSDLYRGLALGNQDAREALAALHQRIDASKAQTDEVLDLLQQLYKHMHSAISRNSGVSAERSDAETALKPLAVTSFDFDEDKGQPLGRGGFGLVVRATWIASKTPVAIKRLIPLLGHTAADQNGIDLVAKEALVWSQMRHPHVLPLLGFSLTSDTPFLVMPLMEHGDLSKYAADRPAQHVRLLTETAMGMAYLHSKDMLHGDLKANNVLVDLYGRAQVADFGMARVLSAASRSSVSVATSLWNVRWIAPERYTYGVKLDLKSDVFSFAMLAFEVVAGKLPFYEEHDDGIVKDWIKEGVQVKTAEDDETPLFRMRAKLFRFEKATTEWKERGTGEMRLMMHKQSGKVRVLMRRDKTLKLCANHVIAPEMKLNPNVGSDRSWVWTALADFSEDEVKPEMLAVRFANSDIAQRFKAKFEEAQKWNNDLNAGAASPNGPSVPAPDADHLFCHPPAFTSRLGHSLIK
ncbi:hypothetical protein H9P43_006899 [Blastocladiella emersonii ATCC 22665]|nr:hypothetical protein H9P43_006899 [Blastocladiella emersonii ATCC 22665]